MHFSTIVRLRLISFITILISTTAFVRSQPYDDFDEVHDRVLFNYRYFLDSLSFELGEYVSNINSKGNIYGAIQYLEDKPSVNLRVILQVNENYDTTSQHFIRTKTSDIIRILDYYGLDERRYEVEKIVDLKSSDNNIARRLISVEFVKNEAHMLFDTTLCQLATNDEIEIKIDMNKPEYNILKQYYEKNESFEFNLLNIPLIYSSLYIDTIPEEWRAEMEVSKDDVITFISNPERTTSIGNFSVSDRNDQIYLSDHEVSVIKNWLGDDFDFASDERTSLPINPTPIKETKRKLECINGQFPSRWFIEYLGGCNGHVFWKFNWSFIDDNAPIALYLDEEKQVGIVSFLRENGKLGFEIYDYNSNNEAVYRGDNLLHSRNSFMDSKFLIFVFASSFIFIFAMILIIKNAHNTASTPLS